MSNALRTKTRASSRLRAIALIGAICLALAGVGAAAVVSKAPRLDSATLCPTDRRIEVSTLILVDTTDPLSRIQAQRLIAAVRDARDALPAHARLTILFVDAENPYDPREILALCNPGSPRDINPFTQTATRIERRWREAFETPIENAIGALLRAPTARRSPIMESIAAATARPDFDARISQRRLLIVSDLIQHEPGGYTHYQPNFRWERFAQSRLSQSAQGNLAGARVDVEYLRRPNDARIQTDAHRTFWLQWFQNAGAMSINFIGIPQPTQPTRMVAGQGSRP